MGKRTLRMPDLGTVEGSVTLVRWLKREGDRVALGEPLFEVETDKGVSEVECAAAGVLAARLVAEGATVAAGDPIASIEGTVEEKQGPRQSLPASSAADPAAAPAEAPAPPRAAPRRGSAPVIAALARKWGVDLVSLQGTGPGGAVTRQDMLRARDAGHSGAEPVARILSPLQALVAAKVSQSHREKPVFHVIMRADMTALIAARASSLRFDAFFVSAAARAIAEFPSFRRFMSGQAQGVHEAIDVAIAVSVDDDLFAPVVRSAEAKSVETISAEIDALVAKAGARSLSAQDSQGSCFLVSNLGMYPVESFDAVVYPDHAAALAVGAALPTPVADGTGVRVAPRASLTLSVDHRIINGAVAARFLGRVKQLLESGGKE